MWTRTSPPVGEPIPGGQARTARLDRTAQGWAGHLVALLVGAAVASAVLVVIATGPRWLVRLNDFYKEAFPSYAALFHGSLGRFAAGAPPYIGSLAFRIPFAFLARELGGGAQATYFATALPCLFAAAAFCTWLSAQPRRPGGVGWGSRMSPVLLWFANPVGLVALIYGHPEDVLGAVLCVTAVILAVRRQRFWSCAVLGIAVASKTWALVAVPVVLAVISPERRVRAALVISLIAGAVLGPLTLLALSGSSASAAGLQLGNGQGTVFYPSQLLWWFGQGSWVVAHAHPLIVATSIACALPFFVSRDRRRPVELGEGLLLLALVLLVRAALDPENNLYYHAPFLLAIMTYEICEGRMPRLTLVYTIGLTVLVPTGFIPMGGDLRAVVYAAIVLPTAAWLLARLYRPERGQTATATRSP